MQKANVDLREEIRAAGLTLWKVGKAWKDINEVSMVRRFRFELCPVEKSEIRKIIAMLTIVDGKVIS